MDAALVGEATDLVFLLCYYASLDSQNIFFTRAQEKYEEAQSVQHQGCQGATIGPEICSNILFLHAVLGCDTTSHLYGIGNGTFLKLSRHFREQAKVSATESATPKEISTVGEQL